MTLSQLSASTCAVSAAKTATRERDKNALKKRVLVIVQRTENQTRRQLRLGGGEFVCGELQYVRSSVETNTGWR